MSGQWYQSSNNRLAQAGNAAAEIWHTLAQPAAAQRLRQVAVLLLLIWAVFSLSDLIWALLPQSESVKGSDKPILNPVETRSSVVSSAAVDIDTMADWNLFGLAGETLPAELVAQPAQSANARDGIEDGARDTSLDLKLRGAIASTEDGLGHAIIEHRSKQEVYAVGDELPVGNAVTLAKVILGGVVLDNNGTYELLRLFEETSLLEQVPTAAFRQVPRSAAKIPEKAGPTAPSGAKDVLAVAKNFRQQLYENPQSLAQLVRVRPVRENDALKGYRVDPGKNPNQFAALGFKAGDVITSVNGIGLDNPGNTLQLYKLMRTVSEAVFDLERGGENITLKVSLAEVSGGG